MINQNNQNSSLKKLLGFRNMQEKLENKLFNKEAEALKTQINFNHINRLDKYIAKNELN